MKIISLQKNLRLGTQTVSHIAQKNTSLPILNNIMISAREGIITLTTTNLEIGIKSVLRGKIEEEGEFTVDARTIQEYISLISGDKVTLETLDNELAITSGSVKTKIKGIAADEFPLIPLIEREGAMTMSAQDLKEAITQVLFAVSGDEARLELSGVLFNSNGSEVVLAGTDSYRLAEKKIKLIAKSEEERRFIIPARTLQEVARIIGSESGDEETVNEVALYTSENQCLFIIGSTEVVSRLIDGHYPDYRQIMPTRQVVEAIVSRDEVVRAVKAAAIFSRSGVNDIIFSFSEKEGLEISAASGQTGEHRAMIDASVKGGSLSITLNHRYVLDGLNALAGPTISFALVDPETPCLLRQQANDDYVYIIMPIKK